MAVHLLLGGIAPLHASALEAAGKSILIAGHSASGKSTLASLFYQRGFRLLADDLTGVKQVSGQPMALPGYAGATIWGDAMVRLGYDATTYRKVHPELDKYVVTPETPSIDQPVPLGVIFLLSVHNQPKVTVEAVTGMEKFQVVGHNTYNTRLTDALVQRDTFFALSAAIAASVPVWRIRRPRGIWTAEEIAAQIEELLT